MGLERTGLQLVLQGVQPIRRLLRAPRTGDERLRALQHELQPGSL